MPHLFYCILTTNRCKMTLKLFNNVTKKEYTFDNLEDKLTSRLWYTFDITLEPGMDDGEYSYTLYDQDFIIATGLLQVGSYTPNNNTYTANTHSGGYVQYNGSI